MSKLPKDIDKILLGAGLVVGGALAALGIMKSGAASKAFGESVAEPRDVETSVAGAETITGALNSMASDRKIEASMVKAPGVDGGMRPVDLMVGVPLYASKDNPNEPIDPLTSADVHAPIPNAWWVKYGADPRYANSPDRDDDGDGFTNLEEFKSGTNPTDAASHPPLVAKLSYIKDESTWWLLEYGTQMQGDQWSPKMEDEAGKKYRVGFANPLNPGDLFFSDASEDSGFKNRFKYVRTEEREVDNPRLGIKEKLRYGLYEDQRPNKKGWSYEVPNRMPKAEREKHRHYDRTAVLELKAAGNQGSEFKVEENTTFALPPGAKEKTFLLKEVTPEKITVEWEEDGQKKSVDIPKGQTPGIEAIK